MIDIPEELIQAARGIDRYLHTKKIPVRDAQGHARFLLGISEDITERKEAQAALVESERRYRKIIEEATDVVYTIDPAGFFTYISPSAKRLTGFDPAELMGKHFTDLLPKGEGWRKRLIEFYVNQTEQKIPETTLSFPILTSQGERRWVEQQVTLTMQAGSIVGLQSVTRDVTERVLQEAAIQESRNRAELLGLVNAAFTQAIDDEQILTAVSIVAEGEVVNRVTLAYVESTNSNDIVNAEIVASLTGDGETVPLDSLPATDLPPQFFSLLSRWNDGLQAPIYVEDVANEASLQESTRAFFRSINIGAIIAIPLRTGDEWQAIVFFEWSEAHTFTFNLRELIESITPTAASVVASRRSYLQTLIAREQAERRSINMEAVAQVSATATTILDVDELLKTVVNLTKDRFGLYHAHIYLLDENGENLVLAAGAGEAGDTMKARGHFISLDNPNSIVVEAALQRQAVIVNDVTATDGFLPNVLLPGTRSELALPMVVAGELIGVLDVQDNTFNRFSDEDVRVQTALTNQVAVAIQNGRAFQEQQKTAERLREVDRLKSQFLANMSHELRTPLNSIIGYSEVLLDGLDGELNADATEDVEAIHGGGKHLLTIINDILDLAKIEAGQMFLEARETNLMTVVEDVLNTCDILARNKGLELKVHRRSEIPTVKGDAIRLKQIILNLVNNGIKFTDTGTVTVDVALEPNQMIKVRIIDTGMGMTDEELKGLFQQFHQVDGSATRRAGGTGLGLVITRHLVTMHGGVVEVESEKGVGTTFWFTVPVFKRSTQTVNRIVSSTSAN
jgi:PAS domain S-box-containing protein